MVMLQNVTYVLRWMVKKHFNDDRYVSEEGDITVQEKNGRPPVALQRSPESRYLHPERQRIIVEQYDWSGIQLRESLAQNFDEPKPTSDR